MIIHAKNIYATALLIFKALVSGTWAKETMEDLCGSDLVWLLTRIGSSWL